MPTCERCETTQLVRGKRSPFPGVCLCCYRNVQNTINSNNKRARRHGVYGRLRTYDWFCLLSSSNWSCVACGARHGSVKNGRVIRLTLDHIHPMSKGGMNISLNTQPLCHACHTQKDGDPDLLPWDRETVLEYRRRKAKGQAFFHQLMNTYAGAGNPLFFREMRAKFQALVESGQEDCTFGEFLIEQFLFMYAEDRYKK